ncbi:MAG: PspA/IM30 family protein [Planctomycetaceae bacterium]|jgi:phage shock protein A
MSFYSRLSDIVSLSISDLIEGTPDRLAAIELIIAEIEEGVAGARRSVQTADKNQRKLAEELFERSAQTEHWVQAARDAVAANNEDAARQAIIRRRELSNLVEGLQQQLESAKSTYEHLSKVWRAVEARLAEALRVRQDLQAGRPAKTADTPDFVPVTSGSLHQSDRHDIEAELAQLRRELAQG